MALIIWRATRARLEAAPEVMISEMVFRQNGLNPGNTEATMLRTCSEQMADTEMFPEATAAAAWRRSSWLAESTREDVDGSLNNSSTDG